MKDLDFKDKSSARVFGKGIVIVIVVVFSSLSFVLGYFVGRVGRQEPAAPFASTADTQAQPKASGLLPPKPEIPAQSGTISSDGQTQEVTVANEQKRAPGADSTTPPQAGELQEGTMKRPSPAAVKEEPSAQKKEVSKEAKPVDEASSQATGEVYTVQLGALRKAAEAKKLRNKFEKKGYRTFLLITKNRKHEKIYKVRVGEFKTKNEAEILALKLRKTEGLKAFVTVKN